MDEAHKIKNPSSQVTQAMKDLNCKVRGLYVCSIESALLSPLCVIVSVFKTWS